MRKTPTTQRDDAATAAGRTAPPRKLLKTAGAVEMWQVEVPGPRWRASPAIRYEVTGGPAGTRVFNLPHEALDCFQQLTRSS